MEPQSLDKGEKLGHFVIDRRLGSGGEATVFLARDVVLQRLVALKVVHSRTSGVDMRTLEEARLIATLDHPNIIRVYHVGQRQGGWYMAMEYLAGGSVAQRLEQSGRLAVTDALRAGVAVADALRHAHEIGVLHRDIKPQNLLLSKAGVLKLADFGLAASTSRKRAPHEAMVGTPHYTAPEVWLEKGASAASDIYALGACLAHLLTGRVPFDGRTMESLRDAHLGSRPILSEELPDDIADLLRRCLAKDPSARPASAQVLHAELKNLLKTRHADVRNAVEEPRLETKRFQLDLASAPLVAAAARWIEDRKAAPRSLPLLHGPSASIHRYVLEHAMAVAHGRFKNVVSVKVEPGGDAPLELLLQRLGQPASPRLSRGSRVARALCMHLRGDEFCNGLVVIELRRPLSSSELVDVENLAELAAARKIGFILVAGERVAAALAPLGRVHGITLEPLPALSAEDWGIALQLASASAAGHAPWTADALALGAHFALTTPDRADRIAHNAGIVRRATGLPLMTSFCVMGGHAHDAYLQTTDELEPRWRERPGTWPDEDLLVLLASLRTTDEEPKSTRATCNLGEDR